MHQCPHNPGTTHSQALMTDRIISHIQISDWGDSLSDDACPMAWNCSMKSEQITPKAPAFMQGKTPQDHCEVGADSSAVIELKPPGGDWRCAMPKSLPFAKPIALLSIPSSLPTWVCSLVRKKGAQMGHFSPMEGQACPQGWDWPQPRVAGSVVGHSCWLLLAWLSAKQRCCFLPQTLIFPYMLVLLYYASLFSTRPLTHSPLERPQRSLATVFEVTQLSLTTLACLSWQKVSDEVRYREVSKPQPSQCCSGILFPCSKVRQWRWLGFLPFSRAASVATHLVLELQPAVESYALPCIIAS